MNTFLIADTHFGHKGATEFFNSDGTKMRPWTAVEEMNEALVTNWNSVVGEKDNVFLLGDVVINRRYLPILDRLKGTKKLIKGNHDCFRLEEYSKYFKDILGSHVLDKFILTHIPVHPHSLERWTANIHGHLHGEVVKKEVRDGSWWGSHMEPDPRYFSVSVEQINYTPIPFETVKALIKEKQK